VSHWLDRAAIDLGAGKHSRRDVLRRGGAVAASALLASAARPFTALAATGGCTPSNCPDGVCCEGRCVQTGILGCCHDQIYSRLNKTCCLEQPATGAHICLDDKDCCGTGACCDKQGEFCCKGRCFKGDPRRFGCCDGATYDKTSEDCCPDHRPGGFHTCSKDETCCGEDACCNNRTEFCCHGRCLKGNPKRFGCCDGATYDKSVEQCCPEHGSGTFHTCFKDETCCGEDACCKQGEECCGSSCVPQGTCNNQSGSQLCGGVVCSSPMHCCHGTQCCTGVCCHDSCCVGATDQCCSNNGGCCGAADICCPSGCCIYGCTADGGCAPPPGSIRRPRARRPTLMARRRGDVI
jgi:hypothetical protein